MIIKYLDSHRNTLSESIKMPRPKNSDAETPVSPQLLAPVIIKDACEIANTAILNWFGRMRASLGRAKFFINRIIAASITNPYDTTGSGSPDQYSSDITFLPFIRASYDNGKITVIIRIADYSRYIADLLGRLGSPYVSCTHDAIYLNDIADAVKREVSNKLDHDVSVSVKYEYAVIDDSNIFNDNIECACYSFSDIDDADSFVQLLDVKDGILESRANARFIQNGYTIAYGTVRDYQHYKSTVIPGEEIRGYLELISKVCNPADAEIVITARLMISKDLQRFENLLRELICLSSSDLTCCGRQRISYVDLRGDRQDIQFYPDNLLDRPMSAFIKSTSPVGAIVDSTLINRLGYNGFNDFTGWNISEEDYYELADLCHLHCVCGFCIIHPDTRTVDIIDDEFKASKCFGNTADA